MVAHNIAKGQDKDHLQPPGKSFVKKFLPYTKNLFNTPPDYDTFAG